jgi:hypothetical protein
MQFILIQITHDGYEAAGLNLKNPIGAYIAVNLRKRKGCLY